MAVGKISLSSRQAGLGLPDTRTALAAGTRLLAKKGAGKGLTGASDTSTPAQDRAMAKALGLDKKAAKKIRDKGGPGRKPSSTKTNRPGEAGARQATKSAGKSLTPAAKKPTTAQIQARSGPGRAPTSTGVARSAEGASKAAEAAKQAKAEKFAAWADVAQQVASSLSKGKGKSSGSSQSSQIGYVPTSKNED